MYGPKPLFVCVFTYESRKKYFINNVHYNYNTCHYHTYLITTVLKGKALCCCVIGGSW